MIGCVVLFLYVSSYFGFKISIICSDNLYFKNGAKGNDNKLRGKKYHLQLCIYADMFSCQPNLKKIIHGNKPLNNTRQKR